MLPRALAAVLQAAQAGDAAILIRIDTDAGHGAGKPVSRLLDERTDELGLPELALVEGSGATWGLMALVGVGTIDRACLIRPRRRPRSR
jgi:hypothetical protein